MKLDHLGKFLPVIKSLCYIHVVNTYLIQPVVTHGPSMLPTIESTVGMLLVEKISPRYGKVDPGDIVVLLDPQRPGRMMTKRVVGLEGDRVTYSSNPKTYEVEGDNFTHIPHPENTDKPETVVVPKGSVWVEGDNKSNSRDSRTYGPVPLDLIRGKVFWRILPFNRFGPFWDK